MQITCLRGVVVPLIRPEQATFSVSHTHLSPRLPSFRGGKLLLLVSTFRASASLNKGAGERRQADQDWMLEVEVAKIALAHGRARAGALTQMAWQACAA